MLQECFVGSCTCAYKIHRSASVNVISCQVHFIRNELSWSTIQHLKWLLNHRFVRISFENAERPEIDGWKKCERQHSNGIWKWQRTIRLILFHLLWLYVCPCSSDGYVFDGDGSKQLKNQRRRMQTKTRADLYDIENERRSRWKEN